MRLLIVTEGILSMGVQVDETRRYDKTFGIDSPRT